MVRLRLSSQIWMPVLLVTTVFLVYGNVYDAPFVYDDQNAIEENPNISRIWPAWHRVSPYPGATTAGRPLLHFSFAVNHAISGLGVWSYHLLNVLIHACAALACFGILHRFLRLCASREDLRGHARTIAFGAALIWAVHPLQTESVTYIAQRAESLAGLWYLLTIYGFLRAQETSPPRRAWLSISVGACMVGALSKETLATAPILILLLDRTFRSRSFRDALSRGRWYYFALFASWPTMAAIAWGARGETVGTSITSWHYLLTQSSIIASYLRLGLWPAPLCFDHHWPIAQSVAEVWPHAAAIMLLVVLASWGVARRNSAAFAVFSMFLILAPSSSVVPISTEIAAEHRMYLPLVAFCGLFASTLFISTSQILGTQHEQVARATTLGCCGLVAVVFGILTFVRNQDYRDPAVLWAKTVSMYPEGWRGHVQLGHWLIRRGQASEGIAQMEIALRLKPDAVDVASNLALAYHAQKQTARAADLLARTVSLRPNVAVLHDNYAMVLIAMGRHEEATQQAQAALAIKADFAKPHFRLGEIAAAKGDLMRAATEFRAAAEIEPNWAAAWSRLGRTLLENKKPAEAIPPLQRALAIDPGNTRARLALQEAQAQSEQPTQRQPTRHIATQ